MAMHSEILYHLRRPWYDSEQAAQANAGELGKFLDEFAATDAERDLRDAAHAIAAGRLPLTVNDYECADADEALDEVYAALFKLAVD